MPLATKELQRGYQRNWIRNRRASWLLGKSCAMCGSIENLEVDHIDSSTKVGHNVWSWKQERRDEELAKCQVLCKDCHHNIKHEQPRGEHGTPAWYNRRKCRCDLCRRWQSDKKKRLSQQSA